MPIAKIQLPDGRIARFEVAEGTTPEEVTAFVAQQLGSQPQPAERPKQASAVDRVHAALAGVNKGFYSDLLGLPIDTTANAFDLVRAGIGTVAGLAGRPDLMPEVKPDRSGIIGSADWIAKKMNDFGLGGAINNPNPQDRASRILYSGGRVAGASVVPSPKVPIGAAQQAKNMGAGAVSGLLGGATAEVAPDYAPLAAMTPAIAAKVGASAVKRVVRGDETGRKNMEQRIQDFKNAGVDNPSAGLASGNMGVMGVENILSQTPGSAGIFGAAKQRMLEGMQARTNQLRDTASPVYGAASTGTAIQSDLKGEFKNRVSDTYGLLNDKFAGKLPQDSRFPITNTLNAIDSATAVNPLAPATTGAFVQPRIAGLRGNILADTTVVIPEQYGSSSRNIGLPINATKEIRTQIGKETANKAIFGTPEQAEFKSIYGGLSKDMKHAAQITDMEVGPQPNNAGPAQRALDRANNYYSRAMSRADDLHSVANNVTPEGAYNSVANSLNSGPTVYLKLRNVVTPQTRQKIVATVINDLGMATPGQQGVAGDTWSPRTFLTNYNKLDAASRTELFKRIPGGEKMASDLTDIAKAADMIGQGSKIWANPSGTAPALSARGTAAALTVGWYFQPLIAGMTAGSLATGNVASRLLTNPKFVHWLAKAPQVRPQDMQVYQQRLIATAKIGKDRQFQEDVNQYLNSVQQSVNDR